MLVLAILGTGTVFGMLPGFLGIDKVFNIANIALGWIGALLGAFLGFGDVPLFLKYSFLNEITLMVAVSFLVVLIKVLVARNRKAS